MSPKAAALFLRVYAFIALLAFGLVWALGAHPATREPARMMFDLLAWPVDGRPSTFGDGAPLMSAIGGGITASLGFMFMMIVAPAVERGDRAVVKNALLGATLWFVVDSAGSIASGHAANALFNVLFYGLLIAPMLAARRVS